MKKVAFLSRVSTLEQQKSMDNQDDLFDRWLQQNEEYIKYKVYKDEGKSGAKGRKRKEWLQMLVDGKNGEFDALVAKSFSRFGRNQSETLAAIKELRAKHVRIVFLEDGIDSERNDTDKLGLFAWLSEQEIQKTSKRIKMVWENYNQQGKMHACRSPYGYNYDKEKKKFVVSEAERNIVNRAFELYLSGYGCKAIAKIFENENIPTKNGGNWDSNTINNMIKNEVYIGTLIQGKTTTIDVTMDNTKAINKDDWKRHFNYHEAIIDEETFNKAQIEVEKRSKKSKSTYIRHSNAALFSNILACGECGATMSRKNKKSLGCKSKYFCNKYEAYGKQCGHRSIAIYESVIIDYIIYKLDSIVNDNYLYFKEKLDNRIDVVEKLNKDLKRIENELRKQAEVGMNLLNLFTEGLMDRIQYKLLSDSLTEKLISLNEQKENIEAKLKKFENGKEVLNKLKGGVTKLLEVDKKDWNNAMLREIIERILIHKDDTIEIKYRYLFNE